MYECSFTVTYSSDQTPYEAVRAVEEIANEYGTQGVDWGHELPTGKPMGDYSIDYDVMFASKAQAMAFQEELLKQGLVFTDGQSPGVAPMED